MCGVYSYALSFSLLQVMAIVFIVVWGLYHLACYFMMRYKRKKSIYSDDEVKRILYRYLGLED